MVRAVLNEQLAPGFEVYTRTFYAAQAAFNWRMAETWYLSLTVGGARADDPSTDVIADSWNAGVALRWIPGVRPELRWE
jgi:hypothetical protein